ncbi:MAG: DoxX family protein [Flavobacteriales bacterium]|jgi:putative oxidoreductase|nr:DoxX family protein [Schleiferiaceae bacterium]|tara:strand:- start:22797 stop:23225 length:429 start_codon:yes stop_codon:yes gene_type:complete
MNKFLFPRAKSIHRNHFIELIYATLRVYVGYAMFQSGWRKVQDFPISQGFVDHLSDKGWPMPEALAIMAGWGELLGGALLALGLFNRVGGLLIMIIMGVAAFVHNGAMPIVEVDKAQLYFWIATLFTAMGPGKLSLDRLIRG